MPSLTDARFDALRVLVPGAPPTTNDMLRAYLLANGATGASLNDLWYSLFIVEGVNPGHINDMAKQFLVDQGFPQPHINDAWLAFWLNGGVLGPPIPPTTYPVSDAMKLYTASEAGLFGNATLSYQWLASGVHQFETNPDDGNFPPDFPPELINGGFDWINPKAARLGPETYHFRATDFSGDFVSGSPKDVWLEIQANAPFIYTLAGNSVNFFSASFTVALSLDGGATILNNPAGGDIILELDITF